MPMYEYACRTCDTTFMAQRRTEQRDEAPACPSCAGTRVARQMATFMIRSGAGRTALADDGCATGACATTGPARAHSFGCPCCS